MCAKIKFGQIISEARGSIAGMVFSRNHSGSYIRQKVTPVNPSNPAQTLVRTYLTQLSQDWRDLTAAQKLQWNTQSVAFAKTDIFGDKQTPSGYNLYMSLNLNILNVGGTPISIPPVLEDSFNFTSLSVAISEGGGTATLTYAAAIPATVSVEVFATAPMSAGKEFVKSEYRKIDVILTADVSPFDIATEYIAKFGSVGQEGQKVFFKLVPIVTLSGIRGMGITASAIVAA
jgi:hypothetical protein